MEMGYTEQNETALEYPGFPTTVQEEKENIAKITATVILAREEIAAFERGQHPNKGLIKVWINHNK